MGEVQGVHRLRDLDARARWVALLLAAALLVAPAVAFAWAAPDWSAQGDPALMGLRALDVGTERTPLTGQPSTGDLYVDGETRRVSHLGPTHFYLMAPAVRLLGGDIGMIAVSVLVVSTCLLVAAWAVFRQLGRSAGVLAVVVLSLITFTTGASSLVDPVSSSIAGYPVLCSAVMVWCLLCGDLRLLPLAAGMVSFAAQQHLSSLPALVVAVVVGLGVLAFGLVRQRFWRDPATRRTVIGWGLAALGVASLLWSPVLLQQVAAPPGNLSALLHFTSHDERPVVGYVDGVRPLGHALGLPPLLGQLNLTGSTLLSEVPWTGWLSAAAVVAVVVALGVRWRTSQPRRTALVVTAGAVAAGGLLNASSMPVGIETTRLVFYHWVFVLSFLVVLILGLAAWDLVRVRLPGSVASASWLRPALAGAAALVVVVPALVNPALDRRTNLLVTAHSAFPRELVDELADEVMAHRDEVGSHPLLLVRSDNVYISLRDGLALELTERGLDVVHPAYMVWFVDSDRLVEPDEVTGGLVLVIDEQVGSDQAAALGLTDPVADAGNLGRFDAEAFDELVATVEEADTVRFGEQVEEDLAAINPDPDAMALFGAYVEQLVQDPESMLRERAVLRFLRDHPLEEPRLDPDLIDRVLDTLPQDDDTRLYRTRVFLLDETELRRFAWPTEM